MTTSASGDLGRRHVGAEELRNLLASAPTDEAGRSQLENLDLSNATIDGDVAFAGVVFTGTALFALAEFRGSAAFDDAVFAGTARFDRAIFRGPVTFARARFAGTLWLNQATSDGPVTFEAARLQRDTTLDGTAFRDGIDFSRARVDGDFSCDSAAFAGPAAFAEAHVEGAATFERVLFAGGLDVRGLRVDGRASFADSRIQGELLADGARFQLDPQPLSQLERLEREPRVEVAPRATSDLPSSTDLLGFAPIARALHELLDDPNTTLPLTVAITAPWGGGKSSVMRQLERQLISPPAGYRPSRRWRTIWFDAWRYERAERLWAALAKEIYSQALDQMPRFERLVFRARLERRRLGPWKFAAKLAWPPLAAAAALVALLTVDIGDAGKVAGALSAGAATLGALTRYWAVIWDPFKRAIEQYASHPDYDTHLGFTSEAESDIKELLNLLSRDRDALAIFIDDLDRCSGAHVVEVVEAINQVFGATADQDCAFVLGIDREVVATSIEVAYRDTVQALRERGSRLGDSYGPQFLAKLVQMSITLPPPEETSLRNLLDAVAGRTPSRAKSDPEAIERLQHAVAQAATSLESVDAVSEQLHDTGESPTVVEEAARLARVRQLRDSDEVVAVERESIGFLEANPRQVKRFHNAFRLQLYIANEQRSTSFSFTSDELHALGRWVALRLRWPSLADAIDREPALLAAIEAVANRLPGTDATDYLERDGAYATWFRNPDVLSVLDEKLPHRRISHLRTETFLPIA